MEREVLLDVRSIPPRDRHPKIFRTWEQLCVGDALKLVNDHDPKPLYYEFCAERKGEFEWVPLERGPETWSVQIKRVAQGPAGAVRAEQTVQEAMTRYPGTQKVFARYDLDTCCGGAHPIEAAAKAKGADLAALLADLNAAAAPAADAGPDWAKRPPEHTVDVREELRQGAEPFQRIMAAVIKVRSGETICLRALFEPRPLYAVLGRQGFEHWARKEGEEDWAVYFHRQGDQP